MSHQTNLNFQREVLHLDPEGETRRIQEKRNKGDRRRNNACLAQASKFNVHSQEELLEIESEDYNETR